jgi:eukaryotic-like serine/threonine-protein kinase
VTASSERPPTTPRAAATGRALGRYVLFDAIARGGMASVHFGRLNGPVGFARTVAIKRLHPHLAVDPEFVAMLLDEARLAARIRHPNVVPTIDVVAMAGEVFIVMEYVSGESLGALWRSHKAQGQRIPIAYSLAIMAGVLHGLHAAHEVRDEQGNPLGIVHRDVSPQNVLVGTDGVPRVLDFGVAKAAGRLQQTGESGAIKGKVAYMPPEQIGGMEVTRASDIYSASVVLWELLTGRRLVEADNDAARMGTILAIRDGKPFDPPSLHNPEVPKELDAIVSRGLSGDPAHRFASAREMATLLERNGGLVPATEIGEWVTRLAAQTLSHRAERLHQIEASTSRKVTASDPALAPLVGPTDATVVSTPAGIDSGETRTSLESPPPATTSRKWPMIVFGLLAIGLGTGLAIAVTKRAAPRPPAAAQTAPIVSSAPVASVVPATSESPTASAVPVAVASSVSSSSPLASSSAAKGKSSTTTTTKTRTTTTKPNKAVNCDPPFTIDAENHKVWKRECLAD